MKKILCLVLALLLALSCTAGWAEGEDAELTAFLQITGEKPVPVYENPSDAKEADFLQPGQLCGLVDEAEDGGIRWFHVVYVNNAGKGADGFIHAESAERLTAGRFREIMEDPAKANEAMDLLEAVKAYLNELSSGGSAAGGTQAGAGSAGSLSGKFRTFFDEAMKALNGVFGMDVDGELEKVSDMTKEIAGKAVDTGVDVISTAVDGTERLAEDVSGVVGEKLEEALPGLKEDVDGLLDTGKELFDSAREKVGELPETQEETLARLDELLGELKDMYDSVREKAGEFASDASDQVRDAVTEKVPETQEDISAALNGLLERVEELEKKASEGWDSVQEEGKETYEGINEDVADAAEAVSNKFDGVLQQVRDYLDKEEINEDLNNMDDFVSLISALYQKDGALGGTAETLQILDVALNYLLGGE